MKTLKNVLIIMVVFSTVTTSLISCKKGDGDPFISLRSRKARVAGTWKLSSGKVTSKYTESGTTYSSVTTYDGSKATVTGTNPDSYTYTEEWEFKKDGDFSETITQDGEVATIKGTWNFAGGVGESKKKEQIILTILSATSFGSTSTYSGNSNIETYDIYELKNKEMVLKVNNSQSDPDSDFSSESSTEKTYKQ